MTTSVTPTEHRASADRDTLNGLVRLLLLDREHPARVTVHWLTDDEAGELAADLDALDLPCDDCGHPDRACRCVAYSTDPCDDPCDDPYAA